MSISTIITSKRAISAIVCLLSLAAMAATPVAVWDGDFTATQTGFTLNRSGNAISQDNSTITIDQSVGVTVDFTTGFSSAMTVMFKYSDLAFDAQKTLATSFCSGKDENRTGVYAASGGTINGIWNTANWDNPMETLSESSGVLAFCYGKSVGTSLYYIGTDGTRTQLYNKSNLVASTDPTINGCTIGGERAKSGATLLGAATGMKITGIAIFEGILSEDDMTGYEWLSDGATVIRADTTVSDINTQVGSASEIKLLLLPGVTITMNDPFVADTVKLVSHGSIALKADAQPSAEELAKFDLSGVQGAVKRSWLGPDVISFNFISQWGGNTSAAFATSAWQANAGDKAGSSTQIVSDGLSAISWSAGGVYGYSPYTSFLNGYLDDGANLGNGVEISVSAIPYETYDVIVYCGTDSGSAFSAKVVNGYSYTWNSEAGEVVRGTATWGTCAQESPAYGVNALRVNGLRGPLSIRGGAKNGTVRGGISAIQIIPADVEIDATNGFVADATRLENIRKDYRDVTIKGSSENGATLDFGSTTATITSHIVFDGGTHTVRYNNSGTPSIAFAYNPEKPVFETRNGATVNLYSIDLSGWQGSAAAKVPNSNILVRDGTTFLCRPNEARTFYYQGRFTIEPGASLVSYYTHVNNVFRMNGGAVEGCEQIYVPDSDAQEPGTASIDGCEGNTGLNLPSSETPGLGIYVGENSTLDFNIAISGDAAAPLGKWGEGRLNFNGDLSSYAGTLTVNEGTVQFGETTIASLVNNGYVEIIYGGEDGGQVIGTKITSYSGTGEIEVMLTQDLLDEIESNPSSSYTMLPGVKIRADRVRVGNAPSGYSVHVSGDGMVLSNGTDGSPEWTGASNDWNASQFDGKQFSTESMDVFFSQGEQPETAVTVTANHAPTASSITFLADDTAYTLAPHSGPNAGKVTSTGTLTVSGLAPVRVETPLEVAGISLASGTEFTYANTALTIPDGALTGSGTFILDPGEGKTNTMSSANTSFTGEAVIASGTVKMGDLNSFGPIGDASRYIRVCSGATLDANHVAAVSTTYASRKNQVLLEEGAIFTSSTAHNDRKLSGFQVVKLAGDASIRAHEAPVSLSLHYNYYPSRIELGSYTLSKIGTNELYLSSVAIEGSGTFDVLEGHVTIVNSYNSTYNTSTFADGTLKIAHGAGLEINFYNGGDKGTPSLTVKNVELDGIVTREKAESALTVTGYVTGNGTTPMLTLAEGAVFKPTGTGYLTITESLTLPSVLTNDVSGIDFDSASTVPLFKVGSSEMLPEAESMAFSCGALPKRWSLEKTSNGLGYRLKKEMSFSIRLR